MVEDKSLLEWTVKHLRTSLGLDLPEDIISYLLSIDSQEEADEFLQSVCPAVSKNAISQFLSALTAKRNPSVEGGKMTGSGKSRKDVKKNDPKYLDTSRSSELNFVKSSGSPEAQPSESTSQSKRRVKQINLFSQEGQAKDVVMLKGRHRCECQASKHDLISNCLKCGRIVCTQEGAGPCFFCGNLVTSKEQDEILSRGSKKSEQLMKELLNAKPEEKDDNLTKAIEHKNKLLEYDRTCERRTQVIDDESDYYSSGNRWLSASERAKVAKREKEIQELRHGPKKTMKMTIDFAGRRIIEEEPVNYKIDLEEEFGKPADLKKWEETFDDENYEGNAELPRLTFEDSGILKPTSKNSAKKTTGARRLQDSDLQIMSDEGMCLSMHQPYASLLVAGIKRHEGRTWYSTHRGRLWIASAIKVPTQQETKELENMYRHILNEENLVFPEQYPTGCLLGCVNVTDVLPQEEYRSRYPDGESDAPYVFICENPQELLVKFPVKGSHKIYKLPPQIHQAAKKSLASRKLESVS